MRIAIFADLHGHLKYLERFLEALGDAGPPPEDVYFLGDVIWRGNTDNENACIDHIRERGFRAIVGNHDLLVTEIKSRRSTQAISDENVAYLRDLPLTERMGRCLFAHTLPVGDAGKVKNAAQAAEAMAWLDREFPDVAVCFIGHYHTTCCFCRDSATGEVGTVSGDRIELAEGRKWIVVAGSLGESGRYAVYDTESSVIDFLAIVPE